MNYNMKDESLLLRPGREQQKILDQYRLTESFRDAYGNHMLGHCSKGKVVQDAITAIKKFREADEVDISQWKDVIIDLMYCKYVLGFRHWEYFGYGLGNKSIAERLEFLPERDKITYYKAINTNRENFLKLGKKHLTYHTLMPYFKRDMCCLQDNGQRDEFFEFCRRHPRFIIKPAGGWGRKGRRDRQP